MCSLDSCFSQRFFWRHTLRVSGIQLRVDAVCRRRHVCAWRVLSGISICVVYPFLAKTFDRNLFERAFVLVAACIDGETVWLVEIVTLLRTFRWKLCVSFFFTLSKVSHRNWSVGSIEGFCTQWHLGGSFCVVEGRPF